MIKKQVPGQIFPLEMRHHIDSSAFTIYPVLPADAKGIAREHLPLCEFNDETLALQNRIVFKTKTAKILFLAPASGSLRYTGSNKNPYDIGPGTLFIQELAEGDVGEIVNLNTKEPVNYIRMVTQTDAAFPVPTQINFYNTDIPHLRNKLTGIFQVGHPAITSSFKKVSVGKLFGRSNVIYTLQNNMNMKCFLYVIDGEVEADGRLLRARDGLLLWNTSSIALEALSRNALVLMVEYGYSAGKIQDNADCRHDIQQIYR